MKRHWQYYWNKNNGLVYRHDKAQNICAFMYYHGEWAGFEVNSILFRDDMIKKHFNKLSPRAVKFFQREGYHPLTNT